MQGVLRRAARSAAVAIGSAAFLSALGCGYFGDATPFDPDELSRSPGWVAVPDVPLTLQKDTADCGLAAVSMVLAHWEIPVADGELEQSGLLVPGKGSTAKDLRDFARAKGLSAFLIHGCWDDLKNEIRKGHPVIVGLVKPSSSGLITHYEVVVALHPEREIVVTHDPAAGWQQNSFGGFRREWDPAGYLTLVVFRRKDPRPDGPDAPGSWPPTSREEAR